MTPGYYTTHGCAKTNEKRVENSIRQSKPESIIRRRKIRGQKKNKDDKNREKERKTYKDGSF